MQMPHMFTHFKASYLQIARGDKITRSAFAVWARSLPPPTAHTAYTFNYIDFMHSSPVADKR